VYKIFSFSFPYKKLETKNIQFLSLGKIWFFWAFGHFLTIFGEKNDIFIEEMQKMDIFKNNFQHQKNLCFLRGIIYNSL
jgi:hypothetical protein